MNNKRHIVVTRTLYEVKNIRGLLALLKRATTYIAQEEPDSGEEVARGISVSFDQADALLQKVSSAIGKMTLAPETDDAHSSQ